MNFELTKEQQDIVKAAREFAEGEFQDRAQEFDREESFDFDIWVIEVAIAHPILASNYSALIA